MNFDGQPDKLPLSVQGSKRGYSPNELIKQFMTSIWRGAKKFEHCEATRHDEVMRKCLGFNQMTGCKPYQCFLNKHNTTVNHDGFTPLYQ